MNKWDIKKPTTSNMGDHDVALLGDHLKGRRVALLITGGVAAMKAPMLVREFRKYQADVTVYMSKEAKRYVTKDILAWSSNNEVITSLSPRAEHLNMEKSFDVYVVAPATYNTINKVRFGIADNLVTTTVATALGRMEEGQTEVFVCPTMHGQMHNSILTESMGYLQNLGVHLIPPRDDYGKHNLPEPADIVPQVIHMFTKRQWLKRDGAPPSNTTSTLQNLPYKKVLVTGGPTPVYIDNVRRITNKFTGQLGLEMAKELYLRGIEVDFLLGDSGLKAPEYLNTKYIRSYEEYRQGVMSSLSNAEYAYGVFSAAVADYQPVNVAEGKIPSGGQLQSIDLKPTEKVIDLVREYHPNLDIVTFKYEEGVSHNELIKVAEQRLDRGHIAVVANRGEEFAEVGDQVAYLVTKNKEPQRCVGKVNIARAIVQFLFDYNT